MCRTSRHDPKNANSIVRGPRDPNRIVHRGTTICRTRRHDHILTNSTVSCRSRGPKRILNTSRLQPPCVSPGGHDPIHTNSTAIGHRRKCKKRRRRWRGKNRNSIKLFAQRKLLRANVSFNNQTNGQKMHPYEKNSCKLVQALRLKHEFL